MQNKIYDCITFFQENLQAELRFNILDSVVDQFLVCESRYDHRGKEKKINFDKTIIINLSGRGDKDMQTIAEVEGLEF